jgi:hypothetical protein
MNTNLSRRLQAIDSAITGWMARFGPELLRISLGIVFLWFGVFRTLAPLKDWRLGRSEC